MELLDYQWKALELMSNELERCVMLHRLTKHSKKKERHACSIKFLRSVIILMGCEYGLTYEECQKWL